MHQIVFLPGASGSRSFFQPLLEHLPEFVDKKVIAYPGFDGEKPQTDILNFQDFQTYISAQIQEESVVIAQSMGGVLAFNTALEQPNKIKALVLLAISGGFDPVQYKCQDWRTDYLTNYPDVPLWFVDYQTLFTIDQLKSIQIPVLLLWADQDPLSSVAVGEYFEQNMSHSKLEVIEQADHFFANTHAERVAHTISEFLLKKGISCL